MARKAKRDTDTKEALADALLASLSGGRALSKIRIKELTDACLVDRQTFYYYFKNVFELAQYLYERELQAVFTREGIEDISTLDWKTRITRTLELVEEQPVFRKIVIPMLGDSGLRKEIYLLINREMEAEFLPHLLEAGMGEEEGKEHAGYISYMLESVLMAWLNKELSLEVPQVLDRIEEMLRDYVAGVRVRYA